LSCVRKGSGEVRYMVAQVVDVTERIAVQARLAQSEEQYRLVAENATDVVVLVDLDGRIIWASPAVTTSLGWMPDELVGKRATALLHPGDAAEPGTLDSLTRPRPDGDVPAVDRTWRIRRSSGDYRWMSARATALRGGPGRAEAYVVGLRDVDELVHERELALREADLRRGVVEAALDPQILLEPVRDGGGRIIDFTYIDANEAACAYNGMTREELIGSRLLELMPGHGDAGLLDMYIAVLDTGRPLRLDAFAYAPELRGGETRYYDIRAVKVGGVISYNWRDVTERHLAEWEIEQSERHYRLLAENSFDVVLHSSEGRIAWVSPSLSRVLGWAPADWIGRPLDDFLLPDDQPVLDEARARMLEGRPVVQRVRLVDSVGIHHWVELHSQQYVDNDGRPDGFQSSFRTVDREVEVEARLERRARFDELTGALKREEAIGRMADDDRRRRVPTARRAVLFVDLDAFKAVNDTWGHQVGDAVLRTVAVRIQDAIRSADTVARMGGDEFLVILDAVDDLEEAVVVAEKLRATALVPVPTRDGPVVTTLSIGVTLVAHGEEVDATLARADGAMYEAKKAGRNQVFAISPG
jgi:diguanylate cyclase (GGDEF)-like protein/PAS domain S-box-containing protein